MKQVLKSISLILLLALLALTVSCKKDSDKSSSLQTKTITVKAPGYDFSETIVSRLPKNAFAFAHWSSTHPAYKTLQKSVWGSQSSPSAIVNAAQSSAQSNIIELLKTSGLDLNDKDALAKTVEELALFAAPSEEVGTKGGFGILLKATNQISLEKIFTTLKQEYQKQGTTTTDLKIEGINGFKIDTTSFAYTGSFAAMASNEKLLSSVLLNNSNSLPEIVNSPQFVESCKGLPDAANTFAFAYLDFQSLIKNVDQETLNQASSPMSQLESLPFNAIVGAMAMDKSPLSELRLVYENAKLKSDNVIANLNQSNSLPLANIVSSTPITFISVDGKTLHNLATTFSALASGDPTLKQDLEILASISRIGLAAKIAAVGQSLLPIPDLAMLLESKNPEQLLAKAAQLIPAELKMAEQETEIAGTKVKAIRGPGIGIFLAKKGNIAIITSSEQQMSLALSAPSETNRNFVNQLSAQTKSRITDQPSVAQIYVDMMELGNFLEGMGGMLAMYAPDNKEAQELLTPENLAVLKKMGVFLGSLEIEKDKKYLAFKTFYEERS